MFPPIPENTVSAARTIYGKGNVYIRLGDHLNKLISELDLVSPAMQLQGYTGTFLAVLTMIQYVEGLTDTEMPESLHRRIELRYALHLPSPGPHFDPSALCTFRQKVLMEKEYCLRLAEVFGKLYVALSDEPDQSPNITDVVKSICEKSRQASLAEAMLHCIEALSANHFSWLRKIAPPHWYGRYGRSPVTIDSGVSIRRRELAFDDLSADIQYLLQESNRSGSQKITELQEIKLLRGVWDQVSNHTSQDQCAYCFNNHFRKGGQHSTQAIKV